MQKIKSLMPVLKERKRYLAVKIETIDNQQLFSRYPMQELVGKIKSVLGVMGAAEAGIMPVEYDSKEKIAVIRISGSMLENVRASLIFVKEMGTQKVIVHSIKASGLVNRVKASGQKLANDSEA